MNGACIVLPARNEGACITSVIRELFACIERKYSVSPGFRYLSDVREIMVVDDCSCDNSAALLRALKRNRDSTYGNNIRFRWIRSRKRLGCHRAFLLGVRATRMPVVIFMPGDGQSPPETVGILLEKYRRDSLPGNTPLPDAVSGIRSDRQDRIPRLLAAEFYNKCLNVFARIPLHDVDGPALFNRSMLIAAAQDCISSSTFVAAEIYWHILRNGGAIAQVHVPHRSRKTGKSRYSIFMEGLAIIRDYSKFFLQHQIHSGSRKKLTKRGRLRSNREIALLAAYKCVKDQTPALVAVENNAFCPEHQRHENGALYLVHPPYLVEIASEYGSTLSNPGYWACSIVRTIKSIAPSIIAISVGTWPGKWDVKFDIANLFSAANEKADEAMLSLCAAETEAMSEMPTFSDEAADKRKAYRVASAWMRCCWLDPDPAQTFILAAGLFREAGCPGTASMLARTACLTAEKNPEYLYELSLCSMANNRSEDARKYLRQLIAIQPNHCNAYLELARICLETGNPREAVQHYRKGLEFFAENNPPLYIFRDLARACHACGDICGATEAVNNALKIEPGDQWTLDFCRANGLSST